MNKQKGMTLITLVVTIIVILILVGITLSLTIGNNGILNRAAQSKEVYEWGVVIEQIRLQIDEYSLTKRGENENKTYLEYLFEDGYIDINCIVQMEKISNNSLKYGRGNIQDGDVYYIESEKLYYKDKDGTSQVINDLPAIGMQLPNYLFWAVSLENNNINLDISNSTNLVISNYNETEITNSNIDYNITLLSESTDLYSVKIDNYELTKDKPYELPVIQGNQKNDVIHKIEVQAKSEIDTAEKVVLNISAETEGELSRNDIKNIEINIMPKELFLNANLSSDIVELNIDNASVSLITENYQDKEITKSNIEYEISLEDRENNRFAVNIDGIDMTQGNYYGNLSGGTKQHKENVITIKKQEGVPIATNEQIKIKLKITSPFTIEKNFIINVKQYNLIDYSGNGYHGRLMNGAEIVRENDEYVLKLDGIDDYVELPTISSSHDWKDGIDIEGTFKCDEISYNGYILSLSNCLPSDSNLKDQILVRLYNDEPKIFFEASTKGTLNRTITNSTNSIFNLGQKQTFKVDMWYLAGFYFPIYLNGEKASLDGVLLPWGNYLKDVERKYNYIGKSPFNDNYFKGYIYELSIKANDKNIFYYNLNR